MSCDYCGKDPRVLNYNYSSGKFNLLDERGNVRQAELLSNSTVHGYTNILASSKHFVAAEGWQFAPIPPRKLVELPNTFLPVFIIKLEYEVENTVDLDFLEGVVPCKALYYSAASNLLRGSSSPNVHFCAKVCSRELYTPLAGIFDVNHIPSRDYLDCANYPDPGWITYTNLNFFGADNNSVSPLNLPILKDFPGIEPAVHRVTVQGQGLSTFNNFGICPQGINIYSNITSYASSRGEIYGGIPSLICVPVCQSASAVFPSSFNRTLYTKALSKMPPLLGSSIVYTEWIFGDYNPNTPDPINYALPIGSSQRCGFSDPLSGRIYNVNDFLQQNQQVPFPQSDVLLGEAAFYSSPQSFKDQMEALAYDQSVSGNPPSSNDFLSCGVYTFVKGNGLPELTSGIVSIERLPYRESVVLYNNEFKPDLSVVDYLVVLPVTKNPADWVAYSLLRMRGYEAVSFGSLSESTMSLVCDDLGSFVYSSCKYGWYAPGQITEYDQLYTAYIDYSYALNAEGIANAAFDLERHNPNGFSPNRLSGNYGYEPYILPGDSRPNDVTDCQDTLKHTHTVFQNGQAFRFEENNGKIGSVLVTALRGATPVDFTLIEVGGCLSSNILSSAPSAATVSNVGIAIDNYLATLGISVTITDSDVIRIKPLPI